MVCWNIFCFYVESYVMVQTYFKPFYETYKKDTKLFENKIKLIEKNTLIIDKYNKVIIKLKYLNI